MHQNSTGYFSTSTIRDGKMRQKFYKINDYENNLQDTFFSLNSFAIKNRRTKCVKEITSLYIDLDFYKVTGLNQEQIVWQLEKDVFGKIIPYPTWLIDSGNGLYYILKLDKNIKIRDNVFNFELLQKWNKCMNFLFESLKDYGADRRALDVSRIFRIPGTKNFKNGQVRNVEIIENYGNTIDLEEFIEIWLPDETVKEIEQIDKQKKVNKKKTVENAKTFRSLNYNRMLDITKLVKIRNGDCAGYRNNMLHMYAYFHLLANSGSLPKLKHEINIINNLFIKKETEGQLRAVIKTCYNAYKDWKKGERIFINGKWCRKGYNYKNETIIELLEISEEEQKQLNTIKSKRVVKENRNRKKREERRDENGLLKAEREKEEMMELIKEYKKMGLNNTQIAKNTKISRQTVAKYMKELEV